MQIPITYVDSKKYIVSVTHDEDGDGPDTWGNFTIVQFKDRDFTTHENVEAYLTENGKLLPAVQAKLRAGKMFTLNYSRYSSADGGHYSLDGAINPDPEDLDGFIVFDDAYIKGTDYSQRRKMADQDLKNYTQWAQGDVYNVLIEDEHGETVDGLGGLYGFESIKEYLSETIPGAEYTARLVYPGSGTQSEEISI